MFERGNNIYFMMDNKVVSTAIVARRIVENTSEWDTLDSKQREWRCPFGRQSVEYGTVRGVVPHEKAFASKEELLASL